MASFRFGRGLPYISAVLVLLLPITDEVALTGLCLFVLLCAVFNYSHFKVANLIAALLLVIYVFTVAIVTETVSLASLRVAGVFAVLLMCRSHMDDGLKCFGYAAAICFLVVLLEQLLPQLSLRAAYRATNDSWHIARISGLFLYPGDLGHFCVMTFSIALIGMQRLHSSCQASLWYSKKLYLMLGLMVISVVMLVATQSRLALAQFAIFCSLLLLNGRGAVKLVSLICLMAASTALIYVFESSYFFKDDFTDLASVEGLKRVREIIFFLSGDISFFGAVIESEFDNYESAAIGVAARLGWVGLLATYGLLIWRLFRRAYLAEGPERTLVLGAVALTISAAFGGPFDRPKLLLFSTLYVVTALNVSRRGLA